MRNITMPDRVRRLLAPPVFEDDEEKTRTAGLLNTILLAGLTLQAVMCIGLLALTPDPLQALASNVVLTLFLLGAIFLMRRGHVRFASGLLTSVLGGFFILMGFMSGGVFSPIFSGYIVVVVIAGMLMRGRGGVAFAALGAMAVLGMLWADGMGYLPSSVIPTGSVVICVGLTTDFILTAVLLHLANHSIHEALERVRQNERRLLAEVVERERAEEALKLKVEQLAALSRASQAVTASLELDQVLAEIVSLASEVSASDYTSVVLVDESGRMGQSAENVPGVPAMEYRVREEGLTSWIVRSRQAVIIDEIGEDGAITPNLGEGTPRFANPLIVQAGVKSVAGFPLMVKDRLLGVLYQHSLHPAAFRGQLSLLTTFANQVAIAIENARLHEQARQEVTERKQTEEMLAQERNLLRTLIDNLPDLVYAKDAESRFLIGNIAIARLMGAATPDELLGKTDFDFYPRELAAQYYTGEQEVIQSGQPLINREEPLMDQVTGKRGWLSTTKVPLRDSEGKIVGFVGIGRDVTERKRTEREIEERRKYLEVVLAAAPDAIITLDADHHIVEWNSGAEKLFGYAHDEAVGKYLDYLVASSDAFAEASNFTQAVMSGMDLAPVETVRYRKDGSPVNVIVAASPIIVGGELIGAVAVYADITERKRVEEALARQTQELARSNAELEQFAYIASHDLQEPLRKVQAFGDRLLAGYGEVLGDQGRDYLERMQNAAARMQTLINDLLMYSRVTTKAQPFVSVDLAQVARGVLSDLETRIEQVGGRVEVGDLPTIEADPTQMRQLLQNLIGNALKFHKKDEAPLVKVYAGSLDGRDGGCQIIVEDNGIGFDEKYLDRIFQVFQRLHGRSEYEGSGIGLATCRKIVERHRGSITAKSVPEQGATFIVTLPARQPKGENGQ